MTLKDTKEEYLEWFGIMKRKGETMWLYYFTYTRKHKRNNKYL